MYVPRHFAVEDLEQIRSLVRDVHVGQLVTVGTDGAPDASLLPVLWEGDEVVVHLARANEHWRRIVDRSAGLVVVTGPDAYITPRWYASKREHGRVVPTWNYSAVHLTGPVTVHNDPEWVRQAVTRLTDHHEDRTVGDERWHVDDAPARFVDGQLKAIVGVSMAVTGVEAKAKLSQNRSDADQAGVVEGLAGSADLGAAAVRAEMIRGRQTH